MSPQEDMEVVELRPVEAKLDPIPKQTMTIAEFEKDFFEEYSKCDSYRYGQHFINKFVKERNDTTLRIWNINDADEARISCFEYAEHYQWDFAKLIIV